MAACGSLQRIFEPENPPSLIESLSSNSSWKTVPPLNLKPPSDHSYTEIFGEDHLRRDPNPNSKPDSKSSSPSPAFPIDEGLTGINGEDDKWVFYSRTGSYSGSYHKRSESLSSESLQLCTESLGFESLDDVEDLKMESLNNNNNNSDNRECKMTERVNVRERYSKAKNKQREFPPPISWIGTTGKPWVCFESYREAGRLLLKVVRIPTREYLHACREDGRLRLRFVQPSDDVDDNDDENGNQEEEEEETEESDHNVREEEGEEEENEEAEIKNDFDRVYSWDGH